MARPTESVLRKKGFLSKNENKAIKTKTKANKQTKRNKQKQNKQNRIKQSKTNKQNNKKANTNQKNKTKNTQTTMTTKSYKKKPIRFVYSRQFIKYPAS